MTKQEVKQKPATKPGKSLADFRAAHDKNYIVPQKIREALKKLGDGWEGEVQFCRLAQVGTIDLANFRDQFEEFIVEVADRKRVWCGTKAFAAKLRGMV